MVVVLDDLYGLPVTSCVGVQDALDCASVKVCVLLVTSQISSAS